jgi:hypothetical protein
VAQALACVPVRRLTSSLMGTQVGYPDASVPTSMPPARKMARLKCHREAKNGASLFVSDVPANRLGFFAPRRESGREEWQRGALRLYWCPVLKAG